jgi:hypothetical protein
MVYKRYGWIEQEIQYPLANAEQSKKIFLQMFRRYLGKYVLRGRRIGEGRGKGRRECEG